MSSVFYESININNYKLLLAYTKEHVVRLWFNAAPLAEKNFLYSLNSDFDKLHKSEFKSEYTLLIEEYLNGKSKNLNIPVILIGTDFNKRVWTELMKIPYGE